MAYLHDPNYKESDFPAFAAIREEFGFLPRFFSAQSLRPDLVDAEINLMAAILLKEGALNRRQKEYIFLACSAANLSTYCVTAHCEITRMLKLEGPEPEQIAVDYIHAPIAVADKALLSFCTKLNNNGAHVERSDVETLRTYGFTDQHILEAVVVVGFAKFANYVSFGLGTTPDFENRRIQEEIGRAQQKARQSLSQEIAS